MLLSNRLNPNKHFFFSSVHTRQENWPVFYPLKGTQGNLQNILLNCNKIGKLGNAKEFCFWYSGRPLQRQAQLARAAFSHKFDLHTYFWMKSQKRFSSLNFLGNYLLQDDKNKKERTARAYGPFSKGVPTCKADKSY